MDQRNDQSVLPYCFAVAVPISLFVTQFFNNTLAIALVLILSIIAYLDKRIRDEAIVICLLISGYLLFQIAGSIIEDFCANHFLADEIVVVLARFGLVGYLMLFWVWYLLDKTSTHYFAIGNLRAGIQIPFIWRGFNDKVLRVARVFSLVCIVVASILAIANTVSFELIKLGVAFAVVNAVLEELLWRGFVLNRLNDIYGEKIGLVVMALSFGIYHYSLGFSLLICLLFSLGGICFGGITIKSRGLLLAIIMHFSMNMLFVALGVIF